MIFWLFKLMLSACFLDIAPFFPPASCILSHKVEAYHFYEYQAGSGLEKTSYEENILLTLNLDMLKGRLPKLYGGITAPVEVRAKRLAHYLQKHDPDLFLAQEVPLESARLVVPELKNQFAHLWFGMGVERGKKESGLFVASKYPLISEPRFIPFPDEMQRIYVYPDELSELYPVRILDRGFFALETPAAWVVTSHLEPGDPTTGGPYRHEQLAFLTEKMDQIAKGKPYILAGDLNIRRTAQPQDEYSQSGISDFYEDFYTEHHPEFDESTYTCTNLLEAKANGYSIPTNPTEQNEIDDYVLVRKNSQTPLNINVELLRDTYDVSQDPSQALTDHRAYRATFSSSNPLPSSEMGNPNTPPAWNFIKSIVHKVADTEGWK